MWCLPIKPGKVFTRLTVVRLDHVDNRNRRRYLCRCSCGKQVVVAGQNLKSKHVRSCGCLRREVVSRVNRVTDPRCPKCGNMRHRAKITPSQVRLGLYLGTWYCPVCARKRRLRMKKQR